MANMDKIVVVDDESRISKPLSLILERDGYRCFTASDGKAALELIRREMPDMILLDLDMPKMDGYQVCRAVRTDRRLQNTYIIVLTGLSQDVDHRASLESGADEFMLKPFNPRLMREHVAEILSKPRLKILRRATD